jgi:transposase
VPDGLLVGRVDGPDPVSVAERKRLRELEIKYQRLHTEHDLLKKVIRFASERKAKSSPSSRETGKAGPSY